MVRAVEIRVCGKPGDYGLNKDKVLIMKVFGCYFSVYTKANYTKKALPLIRGL